MTKPMRRVFTALVLLLLAVAMVSSPAAAEEAPGPPWQHELGGPQAVASTTVKISPASTTKALGDVFTMTVRIEGADGVGGYRFDITYNPEVLEVIDVEDGGFIEANSDLEVSFERGPSYPDAQTVHFEAFGTPPGAEAVPGADGSGALAVLELEAIGLGTSDLAFSDMDLFIVGVDSPQNPDATENGTVTVEEVACDEASIGSLTATPNPVGVGRQVTFQANVTGDPPMTYAWDFDSDGTADETAVGLNQVTHVYDQVGTYTTTLTVENCSGAGTDVATIDVTVEECQAVAIDSLDIAPDPAVKEQLVFFDADVSGTAPISYTWDFGDETSAMTGIGLDDVTHTYAQAGVYTVTLTAENCSQAGPFTDTVTETLTVNEPCWLAIIDLDSDSPATLGDPILFTAEVTGTEPITYTWDFGDGSPLETGQDLDVVSHTYATTGSYFVDLTVESSCGEGQAQTMARVVDYELIVSIEPQSSEVSSGEVFTAAVTVDSTEDVAGYAFEMMFHPDVVEVLNVEDGGFIGKGGRDVLSIGPMYPTAGTVVFSALSTPPPPEGVAGSGRLAVIELRAGSAGISPLDLLDHDVSIYVPGADDPLEPTTINDGTVTVEGRIFLPIIVKGLAP